MRKLNFFKIFLVSLQVCFCFSMEQNHNQKRLVKHKHHNFSLSESNELDDSFDESEDDTVQKPSVRLIKEPLAKYLATKRVREGHEFHSVLGDNTNKNNFFSLIRERRNSALYTCCDKHFDWSALKSHIKNHHKRNEKYVCFYQSCNKVVKSLVVMLAHVALHSYPTLFKCPFCSKVLGSEISMRKHFGLCDHIDDQEYAQEIAENQHDQSIKRSDINLNSSGKDESSYYKQRLNKHNNDTPRAEYVDNVTYSNTYAYQNQNALVSELRQFTEKDYIDVLIAKCQCCGSDLNSWVNGINHFYYIHKIGIEYYCPYHTCNKRYARPQDALCCMLQHTNEHIFTCSTCKARYNSYEMLIDHCDTHATQGIRNQFILERPVSQINKQTVIPYQVTNAYQEMVLPYSMPVYKSASDVVAEYQQPHNALTQGPYVASWYHAAPQQAWNHPSEHGPYITRQYPQ